MGISPSIQVLRKSLLQMLTLGVFGVQNLGKHPDIILERSLTKKDLCNLNTKLTDPNLLNLLDLA